MKSLLSLFPHASQAMIEANPQLVGYDALVEATTEVAPARGIKKRGTMNKTEAEFALILEDQKQRGEILRYEYEGITLRFAGVRYTPDFVVFLPDDWIEPVGPIAGGFKFIEVKGVWTGGKFERAVERFRHARSVWPEFTFEMFQKKGGSWKQIM